MMFTSRNAKKPSYEDRTYNDPDVPIGCGYHTKKDLWLLACQLIGGGWDPFISDRETWEDLEGLSKKDADLVETCMILITELRNEVFD